MLQLVKTQQPRKSQIRVLSYIAIATLQKIQEFDNTHSANRLMPSQDGIPHSMEQTFAVSWRDWLLRNKETRNFKHS